MLLNWLPCLGAGTSKSVLRGIAEQDAAMKLNMLGNPECTRFLCFAALKETYEDDDAVLRDAMEMMGANLLDALQRGVALPDGQRLRLAAISVKGDWPFLISAGNLVRNFRRAPKQGHTSGGAGICHLCLAGQQNYPFSDCGENPRWARTEGSAAAAIAWDTVMPFTALLPGPAGSPERLYKADIWHNWHLGHGRYFLSSAMFVVSTLWPGTSVPDRFAGMTVSWRAYCRRRKVKPVLSKITKETCGYISFLDWPEGGWQKGSTTTLLSDSWTATMCLLVFVYALSFFLSILLRNGLSMCSRCPSLLSRC
jgi:hypothetical protein